MRKEVSKLKDKEVFKRVLKEGIEKTKEIKTLPLTQVYKYKFDSSRYLIRFKTRLYIRDDLQAIKQDYYATILAIRIFRALIALTTIFNQNIY